MELNEIDIRVKNAFDNFVLQASERLKNSLKSVILHGSIVSGEHIPRHSDINILLVVDKVDIDILDAIAGIKTKTSAGRIVPLVLSDNYIQNSTDTFPIEFLEMQKHHTVLWGNDPLAGLKIDPKNLRHQCEWELKSKIITMQQLYINTRGNARAAGDFLIRNLTSFIVVFKHILGLKNVLVDGQPEVLEKICDEFGLEKDIFLEILHARQGKLKIKDAASSFARFLSALNKLSEQIDKLSL
ncbi:MAG: hypothetical protein NTU54_06070 [Candidatus Omnitrophica bacterium]|nr:hypothetical protein [Candidatus Omnitrophota bacterium]